MSTQPQGRIPEWTPGDRFRKAREDAGFKTQGELADATGISRSTVSHLELDLAPLKDYYLNSWAKATGVSADWIRYGDTTTTTPPSPGRQTTVSGLPPDAERAAARKRSEWGARHGRGGGGDNHRYPLVA